MSNLVISNAYPQEVQSLAGGVFNEVAQFGNSVGLAVTAAIAASVTEHSKSNAIDALLQGYRAAFWTIFGATTTVAVITFFGLRRPVMSGGKRIRMTCKRSSRLENVRELIFLAVPSPYALGVSHACPI